MALLGISTDDFMHFLLVFMSILLVLVSLNGFRRRSNSRYLFLLMAFVFFFLDQVVTLWQQLYYNDVLVSFPYIDLHVTHFLEFLMVLSFLVALANPTRLQWGAPRE